MLIDLTADEAETVLQALGGMDLWSPLPGHKIEAAIEPIRLKLTESFARNGFKTLDPSLLRPDQGYIKACFPKAERSLDAKA